MKINHINITVEDVPTTRDFFEKYFGLECFISAGKNFVAMHDDDAFLFNLIKGDNINYPDTFHIGFPQDSKEDVDQIYQTLHDDGYRVWEPEYTHESYTFYFKAPGDFTVEVYTDEKEATKSYTHSYFKENK